MEEEKLKTINKKYHRPENCIVAPKVNSEIWNENLQASHSITVLTSERFDSLSGK